LANPGVALTQESKKLTMVVHAGSHELTRLVMIPTDSVALAMVLVPALALSDESVLSPSVAEAEVEATVVEAAILVALDGVGVDESSSLLPPLVDAEQVPTRPQAV
jgi:hypothetical protein